jgi:hypothetical protein
LCGEIALERIELPHPEAPVLGNPVAGSLQWISRETAAPLAAHLTIDDQAGSPKHSDVLEERG